MKFFIGFLTLLISSHVLAFSYTKELSEAELQTKIDDMMPIEKKKFFITTIVSNPELDLIEGSNELSIAASIKAVAPGGIEGRGAIKIQGAINYDEEEGAFYLKNVKITEISIENMPEKLMVKIKKLAQTAISTQLSKKPVYKFKDDNLKHKLAKAVLESVEVINEKLVIKLSAF